MNRIRIGAGVAVGLLVACLAMAQKAPEKKPVAPEVQAGGELADSLAQRLSKDLQVKTAVGEPIKAGSVTLIPIVMIDAGFGGGGAASGGEGFYMHGEARPLGFVAITKKGTRFISVVEAPAK